MKAIIPVAGAGTRLRPHSLIIPKVLINVGGKPILSHIIDKALDSGIDDIAFIIGYRGKQVKEFVESNYSFNHTFIEQKEILGLAHAIGLAGEFLKNEPVFIMLGDTVFEADINVVFSDEYSSIGVKKVEDPRRFGTAELDSGGFITRLVEKPQNPITNLALVGLYYLKNGKLLHDAINELIGKDLKTKGEYQITDALQLLIDNGEKIKTFMLDGWYDCGNPETILSTNQYLLSRDSKKISVKGSLVREPVFIADSARIENSIIGPHTTIAGDAYVCNSILNNSIIGEGASVVDITLKDSIIGSNANVSGSISSLNISDYSELIL
ncbi:NTP transferase domain-containing protein [candidate division KSB1 bacterium]|nr:NTP transferase domain-containing protein [candidate division KSB1 bacterium]